MNTQLNLFDQDHKARYKAYYNQFYAPQLRKAKESRKKTPEPDYMISIAPGSLGEHIYFIPPKTR